jgi:hypothetical protein
MQRLEAKISPRHRKDPRRPEEGKITGENPRRNGLSRVGARICGFVGLDGGGCSLAKPVSTAGTGNFLKISAQNRLSRRLEPLVGRKSTEIQIGYPAVQAVSCYFAKQAVEL